MLPGREAPKAPMRRATMKKPTKTQAPRILPSERDLIQLGYGELVKAMRKRPELFAHIRQAGKRN
jgi:hypothetical protein